MHAMPISRFAASAATVAALVLAAPAARAEGFLDVYLGGAFTENESATSSPPSLALTIGSGDYTNSVTGGLRGGYWIDGLPWLGVAADVSAFSPSTSVFFFIPDIDVVPISPLLMLRAPLLKDDTFRNGRVQPYLGVGPGIFISDYENDFVPGGTFRATSVDVGLDLHAGAEVLLLDWMGLFVEYRFTYFEPEWKDDIQGVSTRLSTQLSTHHVNLGLGFHF